MIGNELQSDQAEPGAQGSVEPFVPFSRYRFLFAKDTAARLPEWTGSMWRGAMGHALRRTACVTGMQECTGCLLREACAYS